MALDHGTLNINLRKRVGDIDAQIDRWKAGEARKAAAADKVRRSELAALRAEAKDLIARIDDAALAPAAKRLGVTVKQARKNLARDAHWEPARFLPALREMVGDA